MSFTTGTFLQFEEVKKGLEAGTLTLIDVREAAELTSDGKIPKARHIPLGEVEGAFKLPNNDFKTRYGFDKPDPASENLAMSCRSGKRAGQACETVEKQGYKKVKIYQGSFNDWAAKGGAVEKK